MRIPLIRSLEALTLLGDESRLRLCVLLGERELCVSELVTITGISQSRVSTHLGKLREAGIVRDRRQGAQTFYALSPEGLPEALQSFVEQARSLGDATLEEDRRRLTELEADRRGGLADAVDDLEHHYSPGRSWRSLALGLGALLDLGDALDVGTGDGSAAATLAPHCRSLTCVDKSPKLLEAARDRLARFSNVSLFLADAHELPFADRSFDAALLFHTLTYTERPEVALRECARVLRPSGRLVLLCLDEHQHPEVTEPYGERHRGFSRSRLRELLAGAGLTVRTIDLAGRETRKPRLQVLLGAATKPQP